MSKIVIVATERAAPAAFVVGLQRLVGKPLPELRRAFENQTPILEEELFMNGHEEIARRIRSTVALAGQFGIGLSYYELQPGEQFSSGEFEESRTDAETVENILRAWESRSGE